MEVFSAVALIEQMETEDFPTDNNYENFQKSLRGQLLVLRQIRR